MASKASQMHFALILVKGAEETWGIGLIGQRLSSRNQSITLVPRWRHPRCHRGTMEVSQNGLMENRNIDRYILLLKNVTENLKNVILYV